MFNVETMSDEFRKLHFNVGKFPITLHHFTGPDQDGPHDHPYNFTTSVLAGGYIEEVWFYKNGWHNKLIERLPGKSHLVLANTIHRIVKLIDEECVTSVIWHPSEQRQDVRFYNFDNGMKSRLWNESW